MARTEEQMRNEMTGMAAPAEDMPMEEEAPSTVDAMTMVSNFNQMDENEQQALAPLFQEPVRGAMEALFGAQVIGDFITETGIGEGEQTEAPMDTAGEAPMPQEGMMAPEAPMPEMARGGMLNTQMRDMVRQGMSPQEIRNKMMR